MNIPTGDVKSVANESGGLASEQHLAQWADVMDATEQFLLAGLRRDVGPHGDVHAAYRRWYAQQMEAHDHMLRTMLHELDRRERRDGR